MPRRCDDGWRWVGDLHGGVLNGSSQLHRLRTLHLFAGAGGGILADLMLGHRPVCAVEIEAAPRAVLEQRQRDGVLPWFPIFADVREFDGRPWRNLVDVVAGGFPCQDVSVAGTGGGLDGARSGLWREFARVVREVEPRHVFVENSPALTTRGLDRVLADLAAMGYDAAWGVLGADDVGAPHIRKRIWILAARPDAAQQHRPIDGREAPEPRWIRAACSGARAYADGVRELQPERRFASKRRRARDVGEGAADSGANTDRVHEQGLVTGSVDAQERTRPGQRPARSQRRVDPRPWWSAEPDVGGVADGVADQVDIHGSNAARYVGRVVPSFPGRPAQLKMLGNGQVPATAALAWQTLMQLLKDTP